MSSEASNPDPPGSEYTHAAYAQPDDVRDPSTLGRRFRAGLRWSLLGNATVRLGSFAMGLVLARLLSPSDFGVYAVALSLTQLIVMVNDVGVIGAIVQWRGRIEDVAATAATIALGMSLLLYATVYVVAPGYASLAGSPEAAPVLRLVAVKIVLDGMTAVQNATLWRRFDQRRFMVATFFGFVSQAALAIPLALAGYGAYSFAIATVADGVVTAVLVWIFAGYHPRPALSVPHARALLRFGLPLAAALGLQGLILNVDYLVVGHLLGPEQLGYYMLAFNISSWVPGVIGAALASTSLAGFSRLAEQGLGELNRGVQKAACIMVTGLIPIAVVLAVLGRELITVLYGARWAPSAAVLGFLAFLMVARLLGQMTVEILASTGNTPYTMIFNLVWFLVLVPALVVGTTTHGIAGAAAGHAVVSLFVVVPLAVFLLARNGVDLTSIRRPLARPLLSGALAGGLCLAIAAVTSPAGELVQLVAGVGTTALVFGALAPTRGQRAAVVGRIRSSFVPQIGER